MKLANQRTRAAAAFAAAALIVVIAVLVVVFGGRGSTTTPLHKPGSQPAQVGGLQFQVANMLSEGSAGQNTATRASAVFRTPASNSGGAVVLVVGIRMAKRAAIADMMNGLGDLDALRSILPDNVAAGAGIKVEQPAHRTTVGPGWPAVSVEFSALIPSDRSPLFGESSMRAQVTYFWHAGALYQFVLLASPAEQFETDRSDLELTLTSIKAVR